MIYASETPKSRGSSVDDKVVSLSEGMLREEFDDIVKWREEPNVGSSVPLKR